jgi:hypothetical protein
MKSILHILLLSYLNQHHLVLEIGHIDVNLVQHWVMSIVLIFVHLKYENCYINCYIYELIFAMLLHTYILQVLSKNISSNMSSIKLNQFSFFPSHFFPPKNVKRRLKNTRLTKMHWLFTPLFFHAWVISL